MENSWTQSILTVDAKDKIREGKLTPREKEILFHIANGNTNKEISNILVLSTSTVKNHISSIFTKLELSNRAQAAAFAIRSGLLDKLDEKV